MYKTLCVAILLLGTFALVGRRSAASSPVPFTSPQIVASGKLLNQSGAISTNIFTPGESGFYRLSAYATITKADPESSYGWTYGFSWTDATGQLQDAGIVLESNDSQLGQFYDGAVAQAGGGDTFYSGGISRTFQANKGMPITQFMTLGGPADSSKYSLFYTLERLQ
jgi:hypothetical protein